MAYRAAQGVVVRRIDAFHCKPPSTGMIDGDSHVLLSRRDYRLMRAVVRAAEQFVHDCDKHLPAMMTSQAALMRALDAFNEGARK